MSYLITDLTVITLRSMIEDHEAELMKISSDIDYYEMQTSSKLAEIARKYENENDLIETEFSDLEGMDSTSAEYLNRSTEKLRRQQQLDNDQAAETQKIQNDSDRKIDPLQSRQESIETLLKDEKSQYESMKEANKKNAQEETAYFNGGGK